MEVEERIGCIDTWLLHRFNWPIQRIFARHAVDQIELHRYAQELLRTGRWDAVRLVPVCDADGRPSDHQYTVYGHPRLKPSLAPDVRARHLT